MNKPALHPHTLTVSDLRNIRLDLQTGDMVTVTSTGDIAPVTRGADAIVVAAGATGVGITNDGTIACTLGRYGFRGATGGIGGIAIDVVGSASITNTGLLAGGAGGLVDLNAATSTTSFAGTFSGFAGSDQIDLINSTATTLSYASGVLTVDNGSTVVAKLHFTGNYTNSDFSIGSDSHGGSVIKFV